VTTRYTPSPLYAMAVEQLAQAIAAGVAQADAAR
jgi:membrane-bound lytic murein transglycosylase B